MSTQNKANAQLMTAIGFTIQDLDANRNGQLSPGQQQLLESVLNSWRSFTNLTKVAWAILIVVSILDGIRIGDSVSSRVGIVLLICFVTAAVLIYCEFKKSSYKKDLSKRISTFVEGEANLSQHLSKTTGIAYKIRIDRIQFAVSSTTFSAFEDGQKYRLYFSSHSKTLLAAERLL